MKQSQPKFGSQSGQNNSTSLSLAVELSSMIGPVRNKDIPMIQSVFPVSLPEDYWDEDRPLLPHQLWKEEWIQGLIGLKGNALKKLMFFATWKYLGKNWSRILISNQIERNELKDSIRTICEKHGLYDYEMINRKIAKDLTLMTISTKRAKALSERALLHPLQRSFISIWDLKDHILVGVESKNEYLQQLLVDNLNNTSDGVLKPVRFWAKHVSTYVSESYEQRKPIYLLSIIIRRDTTGISGVSRITFEGEDVRRGLAGIRSRQEVRYELDKVGTRVEVETEDLGLKIPHWGRIKTSKGAQELLQILNQ